MTGDVPHFRPPQSVRAALTRLRTAPAGHWERIGSDMALRVFRFAARTVPAYRALLAQHRIRPSSIRSIADFSRLPIIDRSGYLVMNDYADLFPGGRVRGATTVSATSGTSGEPFYFPRNHLHDEQYRYIVDLILHNQFDIDRFRTLGVIGFGLGIWIGGMFTYKVMEQIAARTGTLTLAPVGADIGLYVKTIEKLSPHYQQLILMGYPPFVRDIIDHESSIPWDRFRTRVLTAAEGYSEQFRSHLARGAAIRDPLMDTVNIYGTVELGTMAHETPLSNLIRKLAVDDPRVMRAILPHPTRQPTLAQYHPYLTFFEQDKDELLGTGYAASIPLVRYRFHDVGGVIPFTSMVTRLRDAGVDIIAKANAAGIGHTLMRLPFVYVYERNDNTFVIRGANVYAEEVRAALELCTPQVTARFAMMKEEDRDANAVLRVHVELGSGIKPTAALERKIACTITANLVARNSEFRDQYRSAPAQTAPRVTLHPHLDPCYFGRSGKQRWLIKPRRTA